jgi:hypothetical protein
MSEPFLERLSQFTPDAGRLDRDALLYAAGRHSARPNRGWIALAAALASTQALSLALLWPQPAPPAAHVPAVAASPMPAPARLEPATAAASDSPTLWSARHGLLESGPEECPPPAKAVTLIDSGPPLRAFGTPPPSLLN